MVADDAKIRLGLNKLDALIWRRAISNHIAQTPDRIITTCGVGHDRFQGDKICVNIRDYQYAHRFILTQAGFDLKRLSILFEYVCNDTSSNSCTTSHAKDYSK
jgi:hypothetical protein